MKQFLAVCSCAVLILSACGGNTSSGGNTSKGSGGSSGGLGPAMTLPGNAGAITKNFNPLVPTSALATVGATPLIYEPLLQFNILKPGQIYPWLATSYAWSDHDRTLTFHLRHGVHWSDGKPFSSADVVFSFDLLKKDPAANSNGVIFTSVSAPDAHTVVMRFAKPAYTEFYYVAGATYMLPKHQWEAISKPTNYTDPNPVGTGAMMLKSFSPQDLVLKRNPGYWQASKVRVPSMSFPSVTGNTTVDAALLQGQYQWAGAFEPDLKRTFVDKSRYNHYWFPATGVVSLFPNLTKAPLNNVDVRKAISLAVNRREVDLQGESGYEPPASPTGLILPNDNAFVAPQYRGLKFGPPKVAAAKALLEKAGYHLQRGVMTKNGHPLSLTLVDPSAFTDYMTDIQIIARELKNVGIHAVVQGMSTAAWTDNVSNGNYDLTVHWSNSGPSPYFVYDNWLDDSLSAPIGKAASGDYERWHSSASQALLHQYASASTDAQRTKAVQGLEKVIVNQLPVIPLVYAAAWGEYRTNQYTGWPTPANPYDPVQPTASSVSVVLTHLKPVR